MPGTMVLLLVGISVIGGFVGLIFESGSIAIIDQLQKPYIRSVIQFTLWQAALSTSLSLLFAFPLARALHRRPHFFGRSILLRLTSISLIVPTMVAIIGIVGVHGRSGLVNDFLGVLGFPRQDYLYGLNGILIAHLFFNVPLVTRLFLNGLMEIPQHQWRLASHLGVTGFNLVSRVEWPVIRGLIPGAAGIVFLLCFTSFAIVLALGGGPQSTTLEVAIYQALRFDFNLSTAVSLSLIQIVLCVALGFVFFSSSNGVKLQSEHRPGFYRPDGDSIDSASSVPGLIVPRLLDIAVILIATLFLLSPFLAVVLKVLHGKGFAILAHSGFLKALETSVLIAFVAGTIATVFALVIAQMVATLRLNTRYQSVAVIPELVGMMALIMPPITLGTGLFLLFRSTTDISTLGPALVVGINVLFILPFALRILIPPVHQQKQRFDRLSQGLGMSGLNQWRWVFWPGLRKPLGYALAVTTTLSIGDMGVIALFGTDNLSTLPLLIYRLLGNYRLDQAAVVAVVLCLLCLIIFVIIERFIGGKEGHYNAKT
ncbi:MAG: thiamine/thiamine pyrophosphate ABC transporter, permease protein [Gammaproteobacteria bacterium]|nr:thiamine/thiamine pyrophosphate ABC transporter, permease protein [Gammaproteobacteria bacterium]